MGPELFVLIKCKCKSIKYKWSLLCYNSKTYPVLLSQNNFHAKCIVFKIKIKGFLILMFNAFNKRSSAILAETEKPT